MFGRGMEKMEAEVTASSQSTFAWAWVYCPVVRAGLAASAG
jgi:hypothetical protein